MTPPSTKSSSTQSTVLWKVLGGICAFCFFEAFLYIWRKEVDPFPDYMYLEFFSIFNNYLVLSQHLGNDLLKLIMLSGQQDYPFGFFAFPWLISAFGAQDFFLNDPWFFTIFMTLPLAFLPLVMNWSRARILWYYLLIFLFPGTQILLKSWNVQTLIVAYTFCALTIYFSYLREPRPYKIILFLLFAWLSITIKHLGAFYFTIIFLTIFLWRILRREKPKLELAAAGFLALSTLPLYPSQSLYYLPWVIQSHNPYFSGIAYLVLGALVLVAGTLGLVMLQRHLGSQPLPRFFQSIWWLLGGMILWKLILYIPLGELGTHLAAAGCLIVTIGGSFIFIRRFQCRSAEALRTLLLINLFGYSSVLYLSLVGHTSNIFLLPMMLLLFIWIEQVIHFKKVLVAGAVFLVYGNFFPSQHLFDAYLGDDEAYRRLFNTEEQNPLGWDKSQLSKSRRDLIRIFELYEYPDSLYEEKIKIGSIDINMEAFGFRADYVLHFPEIETLELLKERRIKKAIDAISHWHGTGKRERIDDLFSSWVKKGLVPVLISPIHAEDDDEEEFLPEQRMKEAVDNLLEMEIDESEIKEIDDEIIKILIPYILSRPSLEKKYDFHGFHFGEDEYQVMVHQSLQERETPPSGPNYYLARELAEE